MNTGVIDKRPSATKKQKGGKPAGSRPRPPGKAPRRVHPPDNTKVHPPTDPDDILSGEYQRQICDLEAVVTALRERCSALQSSLAEISESRFQLETLFQYSPVAYVIHDRNGVIRKINRAGAKLLGLKPDKAALASLTQFVPTEYSQTWLEHLRRSGLYLKATTEMGLRSRRGQVTPVQIVTETVPHPTSRSPADLRTVLIDLSLIRAAQEVADKRHEDYLHLIDTVEGIVWEADARTLDILFVNHYAERLLGYPVQEWTRPDFWRNRVYVEDRERVANCLARAVAKHEKLRIEYRVVTADRRLLWLQDNVSTLDRQGQLRLLGVAVDVTQRHEAEEKLRQAHSQLEQRVGERTAQLRATVGELEAFSYSLSHDMRSPLRAMHGYATLLQNLAGAKLGPQELDYLARIVRGAERLDLLVRDALSYSRVASGPLELKAVPLNKVAEAVLHDYAGNAPTRADIQVQPPLARVYGHEALLEQVMSNLVANAVKFVPPERFPHVRIWTEETLRQDSEASRWVRLWVQDNGLGIEPQDQKRIFRIFERVHPAEKYEGTGIGLAIVQKAVERMGGRVGVQSSPGKGSQFWVELRAANA